MATSKTVTLAKYGLTGALGAILSLTITTLTATTGNIATVNATTVNSTTVSATTVTNSSGSYALGNSGLEVTYNLSGATLDLSSVKTGSTSALCVKATGRIGRCTNVPAADGECTCS